MSHAKQLDPHEHACLLYVVLPMQTSYVSKGVLVFVARELVERDVDTDDDDDEGVAVDAVDGRMLDRVSSEGDAVVVVTVEGVVLVDVMEDGLVSISSVTVVSSNVVVVS